jgi:hypothetical protein
MSIECRKVNNDTNRAPACVPLFEEVKKECKKCANVSSSFSLKLKYNTRFGGKCLILKINYLQACECEEERAVIEI